MINARLAALNAHELAEMITENGHSEADLATVWVRIDGLDRPVGSAEIDADGDIVLTVRELS